MKLSGLEIDTVLLPAVDPPPPPLPAEAPAAEAMSDDGNWFVEVCARLLPPALKKLNPS